MRRASSTSILWLSGILLVPAGGCRKRLSPGSGAKEFQKHSVVGEEIATGIVLPRVERWNASRPAAEKIKYTAHWLQTSLTDSVRSRKGDTIAFKALDFRFQDSPGGNAMAELAKLYAFGERGLPTRGSPEGLNGAKEANLLDVLPPAIQALVGHTFLPQSEIVQAFGGVKTITAANCWGTAYEVVRTSTAGGDAFEYVVFYTDRHQADAVLRSDALGTLVMEPRRFERGAEPRESPFEGDPRRPGDVMLIVTDFRLGNGRPVRILEHAAIYVDNGIYFEKANAGPEDPFRLATFKDVVETYVANRETTSLEFRRYDKEPLPHPVKVFGDPQKVSLEERFASSLPESLARLRLNREMAVRNGEPYNTWSAFFSVRIFADLATGRHVLAPEAYEKNTFRFNKEP